MPLFWLDFKDLTSIPIGMDFQSEHGPFSSKVLGARIVRLICLRVREECRCLMVYGLP